MLLLQTHNKHPIIVYNYGGDTLLIRCHPGARTTVTLNYSNAIMGTVVVAHSGDGGATRNHLRVTITIYNLSCQWLEAKRKMPLFEDWGGGSEMEAVKRHAFIN